MLPAILRAIKFGAEYGAPLIRGGGRTISRSTSYLGGKTASGAKLAAGGATGLAGNIGMSALTGGGSGVSGFAGGLLRKGTMLFMLYEGLQYLKNYLMKEHPEIAAKLNPLDVSHGQLKSSALTGAEQSRLAEYNQSKLSKLKVDFLSPSGKSSSLILGSSDFKKGSDGKMPFEKNFRNNGLNLDLGTRINASPLDPSKSLNSENIISLQSVGSGFALLPNNTPITSRIAAIDNDNKFPNSSHAAYLMNSNSGEISKKSIPVYISDPFLDQNDKSYFGPAFSLSTESAISFEKNSIEAVKAPIISDPVHITSRGKYSFIETGTLFDDGGLIGKMPGVALTGTESVASFASISVTDTRRFYDLQQGSFKGVGVTDIGSTALPSLMGEEVVPLGKSITADGKGKGIIFASSAIKGADGTALNRTVVNEANGLVSLDNSGKLIGSDDKRMQARLEDRFSNVSRISQKPDEFSKAIANRENLQGTTFLNVGIPPSAVSQFKVVGSDKRSMDASIEMSHGKAKMTIYSPDNKMDGRSYEIKDSGFTFSREGRPELSPSASKAISDFTKNPLESVRENSGLRRDYNILQSVKDHNLDLTSQMSVKQPIASISKSSGFER